VHGGVPVFSLSFVLVDKIYILLIYSLVNLCIFLSARSTRPVLTSVTML
jgi:hypothetical protein